jgi:hypothetical protein
LLVLGARSFERQGLTGTPLEEVLPVDFTNRRSTAQAPDGGEGALVNAPGVTADGAVHPATRLTGTVENSRKLWGRLPPLASVALVGSARPGAQVLAVTASPGGEAHPLIAVQRYGQGRTMIFAGEASWRWRMMRPAADATYDTIWRQLVRWLAAAAPGQVSVPAMSVAIAGSTELVSVIARDARFSAVADAEVSVTLTAPDGQARTLSPTLADPREGRYAAAARFDQTGVYRIQAEARRGTVPLGLATRYVLVGGTDIEMSDPRLNEPVLQRVAAASGGRYLQRDQLEQLREALQDAEAQAQPTELRDLWHNVWTLLAIVGLLAVEWVARRRVGLA